MRIQTSIGYNERNMQQEEGGGSVEQIRLHTGCINCIVERQLNHYDPDTPEEKKRTYMQGVLRILSEAKACESAPVITERIYELQRQMLGQQADYSEIKHTYNHMMEREEDKISREVREAGDPLKRAIQYAMTGNYIDFGAMSSVDHEKLKELLAKAQENPIDEEEYGRLRKDLEDASRLVYLTDNCGEIVLDKILIREIMELYPQIDITVIVRGKPALNDATMEDARETGLADMVKVIGNGSGITGTWLPEISKEAREILDEADLILSKGQGNFETMQGCGKNIYYMFLCKCKLFVERFRMKQFEGMLVNDLRCREIM